MFVIDEFKKNKINYKYFKSFKNIKTDSLICSFSYKLIERYFTYLIKNNGKVIIAYKSFEIIGILVFEKNTKSTMKFLSENKFNIFINLFFSKYLTDKIILFNLVKNFIFLKKENINIENNILLIAVNKVHRGKKIGEKLITYLKNIINEKIFVMTDKSNFQAIKFYKKNKFKFYKNTEYGFRKLSIFYLKK